MGATLDMVYGLLNAVFSGCGQASIVVVHGHICPVAHGIFPDQGSNPALVGRFLTMRLPGKSRNVIFIKQIVLSQLESNRIL